MRSRRRLSLEELSPILLPLSERGAPQTLLNWRELFGNDHPIEIEVGFGKGLFLLTASTSRPDINFLGVEILRKYQLTTATRLITRQIRNVRLACADARIFLRDRVPAESISAVHVYFPDPWWKKRHHKRRLFTPDFAHAVVRVLRSGGQFHVVSDVEEYFTVMMTILQGIAEIERIAPPEPTEGKNEFDYLTNFERKFRKEGRPIHRAAFIKR